MFYNENDCLVTFCPARKMVEYADGQGLDLYDFDLVVCSGGDGTLNMIEAFCQAAIRYYNCICAVRVNK